MKIGTRLKLSTWFAMGVVVLMALSLFWTFREISRMDRNINLANKMGKVAAERILLRDDYLIRREERALVQWRTQSETMRGLLESAKGHFTGDADRAVLREAQQNFEATLSLFSKIVARRGRAKGAAGKKLTFDEAESQLVTQNFLKAYALQDNINELVDSAGKARQAAQNRGGFQIIILVLGGGMAIVVNSLLTGRIAAKRLIALHEGMQIIGSGNLDYRIAVEGNDELADLAGESNQMAASLKESYTSIENLNREIAERERTEDTLRMSEDKFLKAFKSSPDAILLTSVPDGKLFEVNDSAELITGYTADEMLGRTTGELGLWVDQARREEYMGRIRSEGRVANFETDFRTKSGAVINGLISGEIIQLRNGPCFLSVVRDITEQKYAEKKILTFNTELEQRVHERTAQLEESNKELDAFTYSVSHDLRAPLRAVDGYAHILIEDFGDRLDDEGRRLCAVISESGRTMGRLIDNLLTFSRIGRTEIRRSPVDMATLVQSVFLESTTPEERQRIDFQVGSLPLAQGDPTLLRQVWVNLLDNAVKFSAPKERAVIEVGCLPKGSEHPVESPSSAIRISDSERAYFVRDNGAGFDMQFRGKLFGVFERLHSPDEFEGTGVGLAIAQRIVQRHGGRIWAEGEVGKGATFYFTFPA
jgi:PAS domain S-box-containing protein